MFHAYILKSCCDGSYYKGSCEDLKKRVVDHNAGRARATKAKRPWEIHYFEQFETRREALKRERYFKSRSGYRWLKQQDII